MEGILEWAASSRAAQFNSAQTRGIVKLEDLPGVLPFEICDSFSVQESLSDGKGSCARILSQDAFLEISLENRQEHGRC